MLPKGRPLRSPPFFSFKPLTLPVLLAVVGKSWGSSGYKEEEEVLEEGMEKSDLGEDGQLEVW